MGNLEILVRGFCSPQSLALVGTMLGGTIHLVWQATRCHVLFPLSLLGRLYLFRFPFRFPRLSGVLLLGGCPVLLFLLPFLLLFLFLPSLFLLLPCFPFVPFALCLFLCSLVLQSSLRDPLRTWGNRSRGPPEGDIFFATISMGTLSLLLHLGLSELGLCSFLLRLVLFRLAS